VHRIKDRYIMAVSKELLNEMTADEASTTRDEYSHYLFCFRQFKKVYCIHITV
jgi:hypothetical protein